MLRKIGGDWKLVSKDNPSKVLKNYGKTKPSKEAVAAREKQIHFFKSKGAMFK